jgi:hypothetical protein
VYIPDPLTSIGAMSVVVSVPLILRWVPMNRWYGIRTRKAFASEENWYAINAYGGKLFFAFGAFLLAVAWFGGDFARDLRGPFMPLLPLVALVPVFVLIRAFSRRLPDE